MNIVMKSFAYQILPHSCKKVDLARDAGDILRLQESNELKSSGQQAEQGAGLPDSRD